MSEEPVDSHKEEENVQAGDDWEKRILCSDEGCIGVIGPDGRCKECGKPYKGSLPEAKTEETDAAPIEDEPQKESAAAPDQRFDDDWESRTLCSDESCIGVIGPDGRCKECGKPYNG
jgi:hypothetical protein